MSNEERNDDFAAQLDDFDHEVWSLFASAELSLDENVDGLNELHEHGWQAYGIGYSNADRIMKAHAKRIEELLAELASGCGAEHWRDAITAMYPNMTYTEEQFTECAVGTAMEYRALFIARRARREALIYGDDD
jgi:hypothetical protein